MNNLNEFPRLLVIGNCCLSDTTSNGRTLRNFLIGWPKEKLAQFCIHLDKPDFSICDNYYHVSDRDALNAFCLRGAKNAVVNPTKVTTEASDQASERKIERNAFSAYIREIVWSSNLWKGEYFEKWVEKFNPEVILLQAGDGGFICKLCLEISKKYNIPIVVYNSEAYYFKDFDYMCSKGFAKCFYPAFKRRFAKNFEKLMKKTASAIYCCDMLTEDYKKAFDTPATTIYTATEVTPCDKTDLAPHPFRISYLGNLGVGRGESLVDIATALQKISPNLRLDVYGKIPDEQTKTAFDSCQGIDYKGFVSYEQVKEVMRDSDVLVHAENFNDYYRVDLKYAFSTKIADSLASGTCFMLYAPEEVAASRYLLDNQSAYVVNDEKELSKTLETLVNTPSERERYLEKAKELVDINHNAQKNSAKFQNIIKRSVYGE